MYSKRLFHHLLKLVLTGVCLLIISTGWSQNDEENRTKTRDQDRSHQSSSDWNDRVFIGGNLSLGFNQYGGNINISPLIGYRITERWHAGIGITYWYYKGRYCPPNVGSQYCQTIERSIYGGRLLTRYFLLSNMFAYWEYEQLSYRVQVPVGRGGQTEITRIWVPSAVIGGGFTQSFGRGFTSYVIIGYDILHTHRSLSPSPLVLRVGFNVGL